ncbi:MAG TPA: hypothetical protein VII50_09920 [Acidothermaceae bacterium]
MTFSIGIRPLVGVPACAVAVSVVFVAFAGAARAERAVRVAGVAAFERAGRVAGVFGGVARLLFVLITDERIGRRVAPREAG